jgi:hypothetical protein
MTEHGFKVGDKVVERVEMKEDVNYYFGVVMEATPTTADVESFAPKILESTGDGTFSGNVLTCVFDDPFDHMPVTIYRWLRARNEMGKRMKGTNTCTLEQFNPDRNYNSVNHYDDKLKKHVFSFSKVIL